MVVMDACSMRSFAHASFAALRKIAHQQCIFISTDEMSAQLVCDVAKAEAEVDAGGVLAGWHIERHTAEQGRPSS